MVPRFFKLPSKSCFIIGPRGTGKSTWLRENLVGALRVDLLDPEQQRLMGARPERLLELVRGWRDTPDVVIDEIQKVPDLLPAVHLLIEERPELRFVLTGSSARKLRKGGNNLLAGRALERGMHPFVAAELGAAFDLGKALRVGLIPLVWSSQEPLETLSAYVNLYVRQEVREEGLTRRSGAFDRFLEVMAFSHGGVLNLSNIASECSVPRATVATWVGVIEDLLLAFRVPVFTRRAGRATITHERFYYFDAGLFRALRPMGPLDRAEEAEGAAMEGLVAQHLRAWCTWEDAHLSYWRTKAGNEVDFVVYGRDTFTAIEVKRTSVVRPADLRGLLAFRDDYPEAACILLYLGSSPLEVRGIRCLPLERFLRQIVPGTLPVG